MTTAAWHVAAVLAILVGAGFLPARRLTSSAVVAIAIAPLATGLICSAGAVVSLLLRAPLGPCVAAVLVSVAAASLVARARPAGDDDVLTSFRWTQLALLVAVVAVPLLAVRRAPVDWDARSIWLLHADWFWAGGARAADAMGTPAFAFSHQDYPPLAPATVAAVWTLLGRDHELGQLTIAVLGASAVTAVAVALHAATPAAPRLLRAVAGALTVLAAYGLAGVWATNGYVDLIGAAALAAAAVLLLAGPTGRPATAAGAVCLGAAMLTKNEGMVAGFVVACLAVAAIGWRRAVAVGWLPVAASAGWVALTRALGAVSDLGSSGALQKLLRLDADVLGRVWPTLRELWIWCRWELAVAALVAAAGLGTARRLARAPLLPGALLLWLASLGCAAALLLAYMVSPHDIAWHLRTSADRTTVAPRLLLLVQSTLWVLVLTTLRRPDGTEPRPAGLADAPGRPSSSRLVATATGPAGPDDATIG